MLLEIQTRRVVSKFENDSENILIVIMKMKTVKIFMTVFFFILPVIQSFAQQNSKKSLIIKSDPPGITVNFKGETNFIGITPFKLSPNFHGNTQ